MCVRVVELQFCVILFVVCLVELSATACNFDLSLFQHNPTSDFILCIEKEEKYRIEIDL